MDNSILSGKKPGAKKIKTINLTKKAFDEVHKNVPANVKKTGKTGAAKEKMMTAIALSKARAAGAKIPAKK